jgi:hypothetical protein
MERRRKIRIGNELVDVVEMPLSGSSAEHWNEYVLTDGSVIRVKTVVTEILKVEGKFDAEGNPQYVIRSTQIVSVSASDRARRPET